MTKILEDQLLPHQRLRMNIGNIYCRLWKEADQKCSHICIGNNRIFLIRDLLRRDCIYLRTENKKSLK